MSALRPSLASLALVGCGAGSRTGAETATQVACDFENPAEPTTVNVLAYNSSAVDPFTNTMVKSCTRDNVTVKHDPIDFAGQVQKTTATLAGDKGTYDIIETYGFIIGPNAAAEKLQPLDELFAKHSEKYKLDEIEESMREGMSYDGKLYGLPMQAQMFVMAYRKDVFDKNGLHRARPPSTEMKAAAKKIQDAGDMKYPIALPWLATGDISTQYQAALNSLGNDFVDPETKKPQFDSPESKKALEEMKSLLPYMDPQVTTFDQPKVQQQMFNGTAAIAIMFSGRMNDLTLETNSKYSDKFAFAAPPAVEAGGSLFSRLSIDGWSLPENTKLDSGPAVPDDRRVGQRGRLQGLGPGRVPGPQGRGDPRQLAVRPGRDRLDRQDRGAGHGSVRPRRVQRRDLPGGAGHPRQDLGRGGPGADAGRRREGDGEVLTSAPRLRPEPVDALRQAQGTSAGSGTRSPK